MVQRFMKMFPKQSSPFMAKVTFFDTDEIRRIITALFTKYYRAAGRDEPCSEEPEAAEDTKENQAANYTEMRTVLTAFMALFCDKPEFDSESAAHSFLSSAESEDDSNILELLVG